MWYIIIMAALAVFSIALVIMGVCTSHEGYLFGFMFTVMLLVSMVLVDATNTTAEDERSMYLKALAEAEMLESDAGIPFDVVSDFKQDIDKINNIILKSRRNYGNWFLSRIYHEETAKLELIDVNSVKVVPVSDSLNTLKQNKND